MAVRISYAPRSGLWIASRQRPVEQHRSRAGRGDAEERRCDVADRCADDGHGEAPRHQLAKQAVASDADTAATHRAPTVDMGETSTSVAPTSRLVASASGPRQGSAPRCGDQRDEDGSTTAVVLEYAEIRRRRMPPSHESSVVTPRGEPVVEPLDVPGSLQQVVRELIRRPGRSPSTAFAAARAGAMRRVRPRAPPRPRGPTIQRPSRQHGPAIQSR